MYLSMKCTCTSQTQLVMTILNKIMISRYHCKWRIKNPDKNIVFFFRVKHLLRMLFNFFWVPWFVVYALHIMVLGEVYQNILINPHCEIFIVFYLHSSNNSYILSRNIHLLAYCSNWHQHNFYSTGMVRHGFA